MRGSRLIFSARDGARFVRCATSEDIALAPPSTEVLSAEGAPIGDGDLAPLSRLVAVRCLDLDGTQITDASLPLIAALPALEELWLEDTAVTDAGLLVLATCRSLRFVSLSYTSVAEQGAKRLRAALPQIEVA